MSEQRRLPPAVAPLPEDVAEAAEMAAYFGDQYRACSDMEMGVVPQVIRVRTGNSTKRFEVYAFPEFTIEVKASVSRMVHALLPHSKAIVFLHEAWVSEGPREVLEGSGVVMPPRVDLNHREAVTISIRLRDGRVVFYSNFITGEGEEKRLQGWRLQGDTADPNWKFKAQNFDPAKPAPLYFQRVDLEGGVR